MPRLQCNCVCIDTKCDIVFMMLQVINNNHINGVNSAMLPSSLIVLIPLLYCGMFILHSTTKRVTRVMRLTIVMRVMRGVTRVT